MQVVEGVNGKTGGGSGEDDNTKWLTQNIQTISKTLEVSFKRLEEQAMDLFKEIQRKRREKVNGSRLKPLVKKK